MVSYPIHIPRDSYGGRVQAKLRKSMDRNVAIANLEAKINSMLLKQVEPTKIYTWAMVADGTGVSQEFIESVGFSIDGGSNGFTATVAANV